MKTVNKSVAVFIIVLSVVMMTIVSGIIAFFIFKPDLSVFASNEEKKEKVVGVYDIENELLTEPIEIVTNLKNSDKPYSDHYIATEIVLSSTNEDVLAKLGNSEVFLKDIYNKYFRNITYNDLIGMEDNQIRTDIKNRVNDELGINVHNIYITKFIIQ